MINWLEKHKRISWIIVLLLALEIFLFSSIPGSSIGGGFSITPIAYHFIVFFLLSFFLLSSIVRRKIKTRKIVFAVLISTIYAILDEVHQIYVPMRSAAISDFLIDFSGIIIALLFYLFIKKKIKEKQSYSSSNSENRTEN
jgi:uncharacterized membrane protein YhaH (DUF805 family)